MKKIFAIVVSCVMMSLFLVGCGANSVDLQGAYDCVLEQRKSEFEGDDWEHSSFANHCSIASDGSCIKIDVYYDDHKDTVDNNSVGKSDAWKEAYAELGAELGKEAFDTTVEQALTWVQDINGYLGLSEAVYEEIVRTSGSDGKQSTEENGVIVTWEYSKYNYFNVMYTKAE